VGCYRDNMLSKLLQEIGISYFKDGGGNITNSIREFIEAHIFQYEIFKRNIYQPENKRNRLNLTNGNNQNGNGEYSIEDKNTTNNNQEPKVEEIVESKENLDTKTDPQPDLNVDILTMEELSLNSSEEEESNNTKTENTLDIPGINELIEDHYDVQDIVLGKGEFGVVKLGKDKKNNDEVAIKVIDKQHIKDAPILQNEIDILRRCNHPHIVQLKAVFETESFIYIVMELVRGGELYEEIIRRNSFSEKDASYIFRQIVEALDYLHDNGIIHRDLKLENLLLVNKNATGKDIIVKLADFGLSRIYQGQMVKTACGTPFYVAPEVLLGTGYGPEVDMWSSGVMLYILLSGRLPFHAQEDHQLFNKILRAEFQFKSPQFDTISTEAKDIISNLIVLNPKKRLTAKQCLEHPFIKNIMNEEPLPNTLYEGLTELSISRRNFLK